MGKEFKLTFILIIFCLGCGLILVKSFQINQNTQQEEQNQAFDNGQAVSQQSEFVSAKIYVSEDQEKIYHLVSSQLTLLPQSKRFTQPVGTLFNNKGPIDFSGNLGLYDEAGQRLEVFGQVKVLKETSEVESEQLSFYRKDNYVELKGSVDSKMLNLQTRDDVRIRSDQARVWPNSEKGVYLGHVKGVIKRKREYESPIFFETDRLNLDMVKQEGELIGNVKIRNKEFKANSFNGKIFFENYNKKLKYYSLNDDVRLEDILISADGSKVVRKGICEKLEVFHFEQKAILTGRPKVFQGSDVVKGSKIVLRRDVDIVEVTDSSSILKMKEN